MEAYGVKNVFPQEQKRKPAAIDLILIKTRNNDNRNKKLKEDIRYKNRC